VKRTFTLASDYLRAVIRFFCFSLLFCFGFGVQTASGQKAKEYIALGDRAWQEENWALAHHYYKEAYVIDSLNFEFGVKYAEGLRMIRDYSEALRLYDKVYKKDKGKLFPEGLFHLASMQKIDGDYREALRNFKKAQKFFIKDKQGYYYGRAEAEIAACTFAINARYDTTLIILDRPDGVNSGESELSPWFAYDRLWFASYPPDSREPRAEERIRIMASVKKDSLSFLKPEPAEPLSAKGDHLANLSFHPNGKRVYFSRCPAGGNCEIWTAEFDGKKFSDAKAVKGVNGAHNSTMPAFALISGKEVLFLASDRPGGRGKLDIYWAMAKSETEFELPVNAGSEINTEENEVSPFYADGVLWFSSDGHAGFGGLDIFKSTGKPRDFSKPENVGPPINSSLNDLYYFYAPEEKTGYFSSNRERSRGSTCCNDIFRFRYADSLKTETAEDPYASLESLNKYLPVTLYFHNDEPNPRTKDTVSTITYGKSYDDYLKLRDKYEKEVSKGLSGDAREDAVMDVEEFFDFYVKKGMSDLDRFAELLLPELEKGTDIELIVKGFASPRAKSDYNLNLTKRRISSLEKHLKVWRNGILLPYFNGTASSGATLEIVFVPFGEYRADQNVTDELGDERGSIYSRGARMERKIEIQSVQRAKDETELCIQSPAFAIDLGRISASESQSFSFILKNCGSASIVVEEVQTPCDCTSADILDREIKPGRAGEISVRFSAERIKPGIFSRTVLVYFSGHESPRELTIMGEVIVE
jgi:tetratricopeptide (TPR) repeat protein